MDQPSSAQAPPDHLQIAVVGRGDGDAEHLVALLEQQLPQATVAVATTLRQGLALLASPRDAVITDLALPDADGIAALQAIRAAVPDAPVLVLTDGSDSAVGMTAMLAGADDYLAKDELDGWTLATAVQYAVARTGKTAGRRLEGLALTLLNAVESPTCAVGRTGTIIATNTAWAGFTPLGAGADDVGRSYVELCERTPAVDSASVTAIVRGLQAVLAGRTSRFQLDYACTGAAETQWFSVRISSLPEADGALLTHIDITASQLAEQALSHQTLHDRLTDLPNRDLLAQRLPQAMASAARSNLLVGLAFIDLDQFKRVNDSLGHQVGDDLLAAVSRRLRSRIRPGDTLARFVGDQFVVAWPDLESAADAAMLAERLHTVFAEPFQLPQATLSLTASIGVAVGAAPDLSDDLLLAADAAMVDAKSRGRGGTRIYSAELRTGAESRVRLEAELRHALAEGEFVLHYQPVVDLRLGTVRGVEALVRWAHPDGVRMPDSFIPVAESTGLIVELGTWVLHEACRQAAQWEAQGICLDMAVNLSVRQVSQPDVVTTIRQALEASGLDPCKLMLEVTESLMFQDAESAQVALSQIAGLGAHIAIDDFGTGYSSLLYLKRYPVGALKIDRSFVAGMQANNDDHAIVTSVVSLARAVGSICIAEGVETPEQHAALLAMGCDHAQGYLFGRPVPAHELPAAVDRCNSLLQDSPSPPAPAAPPPPTIEGFVVDRITQMHSAGASLHTIAAALNHEHAPHPETGRWHGATVARVIAGGHGRSNSLPALARPRNAPAIPLARRSAHRPLLYADPSSLGVSACSSLSAALTGSEAVLVLATAAERAAIERELTGAGHDLEALSLVSQYRAWDADQVLRGLTVGSRPSGHLFREMVGRRVETAVDRFGRARVYGGLSGLLWERGHTTAALALEDLWQQLAARLPVDVICGYHLAAIDGVGSDDDRRRLQHGHPDAA